MYTLVKQTIPVPNMAAAAATANNVDKKLIFKNRTPCTDCESEINNTQVDNAKDIIQKHLEVYGSTVEINHLKMIMLLLLISMRLMLLIRLILNKK